MILSLIFVYLGLIVVGKSSITYFSGTGIVQAVAIDSTFFTSWCMIDSDGSRFLLGDQNGGLYVLVLLKNSDGVVATYNPLLLCKYLLIASRCRIFLPCQM